MASLMDGERAEAGPSWMRPGGMTTSARAQAALATGGVAAVLVLLLAAMWLAGLLL